MHYCYLSEHWAIMLDWDKFDFTRLETREQSPPFPGASRQARTDQRCRPISRGEPVMNDDTSYYCTSTAATSLDNFCENFTWTKKQPLRPRPNCLYIILRTMHEMLDAVIIFSRLVSSVTSWLTEGRKHMARVVCWAQSLELSVQWSGSWRQWWTNCRLHWLHWLHSAQHHDYLPATDFLCCHISLGKKFILN